MGQPMERELRPKNPTRCLLQHYGSFKEVIACRYYCLGQNRRSHPVVTNHSTVLVACASLVHRIRTELAGCAHCSQRGYRLTETPSQHMLPWSPGQEKEVWGCHSEQQFSLPAQIPLRSLLLTTCTAPSSHRRIGNSVSRLPRGEESWI